MHYVYVLHSASDDGLYIGYSANLRRRFAQHDMGSTFATSYRGPWKLIYYEAYIEQMDALGRERYLKSGAGRRFLHAQIRHYLQKQAIRSARKRSFKMSDTKRVEALLAREEVRSTLAT